MFLILVQLVVYAMVCTRPNLLHAMSVVSRYMHNPSRDHWEAVKWILRYVKRSIDRGLVFDRNKAAAWDVAILLILIMLVILIGGGLFQGISLLCAQMLSNGKHRFSILQLFLLQKLSMLLLLKV